MVMTTVLKAKSVCDEGDENVNVKMSMLLSY